MFAEYEHDKKVIADYSISKNLKWFQNSSSRANETILYEYRESFIHVQSLYYQIIKTEIFFLMIWKN